MSGRGVAARRGRALARRNCKPHLLFTWMLRGGGMSRIRRAAALVGALGLALFLLGCAADSTASGSRQQHGFYGGVSLGGGHI